MEPSSVLEYLQSKQIVLEINPNDLKRIPQDRPVILVANRWIEGIDEFILLEVGRLLPHQLLVIPPNEKIHPAFESNFLKIAYQLKDAALFGDYYSKVIQALKGIRLDRNSLGIPLDFPGNRFRESRRVEWLNDLVDTLLQFGIDLVPVRIQSPKLGPLPEGRGTKLVKRLLIDPLKVHLRIGQPIRSEEVERLGTTDKFRRYLQSRIYS